LVEGENIDVMALILLNDTLSIILRVERVHQDEGHIAIVGTVQVLLSETLRGKKYLNLTDCEIKKRVAFSNLDDGLWSNTSHAGTETAIKFEDNKLIEESSTSSFANVIIVDDLFRLWWLDTIPITTVSCDQRAAVHFVSFGLVAKITREQTKKVVHFNSKFLNDQLGDDCQGHTSLASGGAVSTNFFNSFLMVVAARLLLVLS